MIAIIGLVFSYQGSWFNFPSPALQCRFLLVNALSLLLEEAYRWRLLEVRPTESCGSSHWKPWPKQQCKTPVQSKPRRYGHLVRKQKLDDNMMDRFTRRLHGANAINCNGLDRIPT